MGIGVDAENPTPGGRLVIGVGVPLMVPPAGTVVLSTARAEGAPGDEPLMALMAMGEGAAETGALCAEADGGMVSCPAERRRRSMLVKAEAVVLGVVAAVCGVSSVEEVLLLAVVVEKGVDFEAAVEWGIVV